MVYFSTQITGKYYFCAVKINLGFTPIAMPNITAIITKIPGLTKNCYEKRCSLGQFGFP